MSSSHETFVKQNRSFWEGVSIVESVRGTGRRVVVFISKVYAVGLILEAHHYLANDAPENRKKNR